MVIDTLRTLSDARRALPLLRRTGRPVVAILLTHSHPDHVGGAGVLHAAYPQAPVYASEATLSAMRADRLGFYALTRQQLGADYPAQLTYPNRPFGPDQRLTIGGLRLETIELGPGESETATAYYEPSSGALFSGDLVNNHATPALLEGHTCGWLGNLDRLHARFPQARTIYPGHGAPGEPARLIAQQRVYLDRYRQVVERAVAANSPAAHTVTAGEQRSIIAELDRDYRGYQRVASLPTLQEENIKAVARELVSRGRC